METNWRAALAQDSRDKIVSRIMDTLQSHIALPGQDGLSELWNIAHRFEEKIFYAASDQHNYLEKISSTMLILETRMLNVLNCDPLSATSTSANASSTRPLESDQEREHAMETNWRVALTQDIRNKIVSRIMDTLQMEIPLPGLWKNIANHFEEKIFYAASDQHDYLRKISLKMLNLEIRRQNALNGGLLNAFNGRLLLRGLLLLEV